MKHILWGILLVVLVGCGETSPGSSTSHFKTLRVEQQDLTQDRQFTARIESQQNIDVRPLITGIVQKICVKEGARVKKGEPLLIIDQAPYLAAVDAAKAQVSTARAALSTAQLNLEGKQFWQQVKSKTEAEIQTKGFRRAFALRPAIMKWAKGQKHIQTMQYFFLPFYPVLRLLGQANNMREIALSQLALVRDGFEKFAVSPKDISSLAKKFEKSI